MLSISLIFLGINCGNLFFFQDQVDTRSFLKYFFNAEISAVPENISYSDHKYILSSLKKNIGPWYGKIITRKTDPDIISPPLTITLTDAELDTLRKKFNTPSGYSWVKDKTITYSFTNPVFLRGNSLCFFYYSYWCGQLCGEGKFMVYRKINGNWEPYITIWEWIS